jgi:hypothetical protein
VTTPAALYWQAMNRVTRRARLGDPALLREAVRLANSLANLAWGTPVVPTATYRPVYSQPLEEARA